MSSVSVTIGAENKLYPVLEQSKQQMRKWAADVKSVRDSMMRETFRTQDSGGAGAGGGRAGYYAIGNVANQVQDIAVQLQGGAKASTVIAQQGSQILSAFGPYGAIAGGVLAIGAGIWNWVSGTQAAQKEAEDYAKILEKQRSGTGNLESSIRKNREAIAVLKTPGKQNKEIKEEEIRFQNELEDIGRQYVLDDKTKNEAIEVATQLHNIKMQQMQERFDDAWRDRQEEAAKANAKVQQEAQEKELQSYYAQQDKLAEAQRDQDQYVRQQREKQAADFDDFITQFNEGEADKKKKQQEDMAEMAQNVAKAEGDTLTKGLEGRAQDIMAGPKAAASKRAQQRADERASRRAVNEMIDAEDRAIRKAGGRGLTPEQKDMIRNGEKNRRDAARDDKDSAKNIAKIATAVGTLHQLLIKK